MVAVAVIVACSGNDDEGARGVATGGTGGAPASGGATLGGAAIGGGSGALATGGSASGGVAAGGSTVGGAPAGGTPVGGQSSGGVATGGASTGGASGGPVGGGVATGGLATGGESVGGAPQGGSPVGGQPSGGMATGGVSSGGTSGGGTGGLVSGGGTNTGGLAIGGQATGAVGGGGTESGGSGGDPSLGGESSGGATTGGTGGQGTGGQGTGGVDPSQPITIWLAGDSTMANGNTPCPTGWGKHFDPLFDDATTVVNSAVGGRSVRTWLYSVTTTMGGDGECVLEMDAGGAPLLQDRWQAMLDGMGSGDYLLIQFGINDGSATCDRHVGLEAFKAEYRMMAEAALERGASPVFITPVSSISCSGTTARGTRGGYVTATIEVGTELGIPVIDLHQLSVDLYNELAFCPVPGGDVSASTTGPVGDFFCDDHTHFSEIGAPQIAALVAGALRDQALPLAAHLR